MESNAITTTPISNAIGETEPDPRRWGILAVVIVAQLMIVLDASIVTIALPSAQHALHISTANRQWVITAYTIAFGGLLLLGGRIADFSGRKRSSPSACSASPAIGLGGLAADHRCSSPLALFRELLGPDGSGRIVDTDHHLQNDPKERQGVRAYGAVSGAGGAIGVLLGGCSPVRPWRWCLLVNVPIAILASMGAVVVVHESRTEGSTRYDVPGAVLSTLGLVNLVYGFTEAESDGWGATITIVLLLPAAILLAAFVFLETRPATPSYPFG